MLFQLMLFYYYFILFIYLFLQVMSKMVKNTEAEEWSKSDAYVDAPLLIKYCR